MNPHNADTQYKSLEGRVDFLVECSRTSHEELLFRVKHRDDWLKIQLIGQLVLIGLASGIEIGGVRAAATIPVVLALAIPSSFILAALYVVEDRLVGLLSDHRADLSEVESRLSDSATIIPSFEASVRRPEFIRTTLPIRIAAQCVAFVLIPFGLAVYRFAYVDAWTPF